jgi:hypothetical protein
MEKELSMAKERIQALIQTAETILDFEPVWSDIVVNDVARKHHLKNIEMQARIAMAKLHLLCIIKLSKENNCLAYSDLMDVNSEGIEFYSGPMNEQEFFKALF